MNVCKCGRLKLGPIVAPKGSSFQMGCPTCKDTVEVKA